MFKRHFLAFLALFVGAFAYSQTPVPIPVTGNLSAISGQPGAYNAVVIQLNGCSAPMTIPGYSVIVQDQYLLQANAAGIVNGTVWPNDLIDCNGTTGQSSYSVQYLSNGTPTGTVQCYQVISVQGVWNLQSQQPVSCSVAPPNPQDGTFNNLNVLDSLTLSEYSASIGYPLDVNSGGSVGLLSYIPLNPANNLNDVNSAVLALGNLFNGAGIVSSQLFGTDSNGHPQPVSVGTGLVYTPSSTGQVAALNITSLVWTWSIGNPSCPVLSFSGGGGSAAAATLICATIPGPGGTSRHVIEGYTITNPGSGYTSAPAVSATNSTGTVTSYLGNAASLALQGYIANTTATVPSGTVVAPGALLMSNFTMPGLGTGCTITFSPATDFSTVTGWAPGGGLSIYRWPTANTVNWYIYNDNSSSVTTNASATFNVSAKC